MTRPYLENRHLAEQMGELKRACDPEVHPLALLIHLLGCTLLATAYKRIIGLEIASDSCIIHF